MPAKIHHVTLTEEQRQKAEIVAHSYKHSQRERKRARILLLADANRTEGACNDASIEEEVGVCNATVEQVRRRFAQGGLEKALYHQEQLHRKARALDGTAEAFLVATVCSTPPEGRARWSLHLLADKLIVEGYADAVSHETVRQTLKKMNLSLG